MTARTRLSAARLLPVAERVAAEHDLPLETLLSVTGRVSPAQAALFRALERPAAEVGRLLGWAEMAVTAALEMPDAPKSGVRLVAEKRAHARRPIDAMDARLTKLEKRVRNLGRLGERIRALSHELRAARGELESLRGEVADWRALAATLVPGAREDGADREAERHLARFGDAADVVKAACVAEGVRLCEVMSSKPVRKKADAAVGRARQVIIVTLTTDPRFRWSQPQIGALLRMNHSTVYHWQRRLDVAAAGRWPNRRAAA